MYDKVVKYSATDIKEAITHEFKSHIQDILDKASDIYSDLLLGVFVEKDSLADPEYFFDTFIDRMSKFDYVPSSSSVTLELPNEDTFDFSGELVILKFIMEGVVGNYVELPEKDLNIILKTKGLDDKVKRRYRTLPGITTGDVPMSRRFRLLNVRSELTRMAQEILKRKLVNFPFSNSPPLEVFSGLKEYVEDNIEFWISSAISRGLNNLTERRL